jgi:hypothetical protein
VKPKHPGAIRHALKSAKPDFAERDELELRQDAFTRDGAYHVKAGSPVVFVNVTPNTHNGWSRCVIVVGDREHLVELATANLRRSP